MISLLEFADRLRTHTVSLGWVEREVPELQSTSFRGREDEVASSQLANVIGLMLGEYPVLLVELEHGDDEYTSAQLRALHRQAIIARSFLTNDQIINLHAFMLFNAPNVDVDWRRQVDLIERDEAICRKMVWVPHVPFEGQFEAFVERTFLGRPWRSAQSEMNAPLDEPAGLVRRVLMKMGLSEHAAEQWIAAALTPGQSPKKLVHRLADLLDTK